MKKVYVVLLVYHDYVYISCTQTIDYEIQSIFTSRDNAEKYIQYMWKDKSIKKMGNDIYYSDTDDYCYMISEWDVDDEIYKKFGIFDLL